MSSTMPTRRSPHSPRGYTGGPGYGGVTSARTGGRAYAVRERNTSSSSIGPVLGWTPRAPGSSGGNGSASGSAGASANGVGKGSTGGGGAKCVTKIGSIGVSGAALKSGGGGGSGGKGSGSASGGLTSSRTVGKINVDAIGGGSSGGGVNGNGTPTWLQGCYRGEVSPTRGDIGDGTRSGGVGVLGVEAWCKARVDLIRAIADGASGVVGDIPELRAALERLEYSKMDIEHEVARKAARDRWRAHERITKAHRELRRAERATENMARRVRQMENKLARLNDYSRFIENKWVAPKPRKSRSPPKAQPSQQVQEQVQAPPPPQRHAKVPVMTNVKQ